MGDFFLKLLDWPFLLFIGIGILINKYRGEIGNVISRGGITMTWGDKSFEVSQLPEHLNESFAPLADDVEDLKARIAALEASRAEPVDEQTTADSSEMTDDQKEAARERMMKGLESGKYIWRSIERLATIGGITTTQASNILRPMPEVVFSRGTSGRTIVKLAHR